VYDDARQTRGFALQLRTPADLVVFQRPRLWTLQRALAVCAVLGGAVLLGVAWITALRRRVHQQTRQLREQMERQSRLEAEVQHAARLESLGALAGGIAHDFNNLLTIILGNLGLALLDGKLSESTRRCLHEIERGTARARALTRQLLTFAKGGEPLRAPIALPEIVRLTADRARQGSAVRGTYQFAPDLWLAYADKDQIAQVVHNLVGNALEAMPAGGDLRLELANDDVAEGAHRALRPGRYVRLAVTDSGEGIRPEVLPRIFDPYFSTRKAGSGLGLATVYSIVKRHEGSVEVESTPGAGATFTVRLPAADGAAPEPEPVPEVQLPLVPPARKTARVLLLEDEPSIQQVLAEVLGRMGVAVKVTAEGAATLKEFTVAMHQGAPFDLLILDLTVPGGMGGREVIELIRKLDPHVPAIVSSGYSSDPVMANYGQYGFQAMVQKPYEIGQLITVVERVLARRRAGGSAPVT
jgi:signal transduction histidine kinase/ActR/RegA family two-component response regulator